MEEEQKWVLWNDISRSNSVVPYDGKVDTGGVVVDNFSFQGFMALDMVFWGT